jgi:two-component system, response regulator
MRGSLEGPTTMKTNVILLVEDNPDDADLAKRAFEMGASRPTVALARDGVEALDYLFGTGTYTSNPPGLPDVVLLDLKLPRVDGLEVLRRLRADERTRYLPIVIMTSSLRPDDVEQSYALGANSYVRKPVDFSQFLETANALGAYWLTVNQLIPRF